MNRDRSLNRQSRRLVMADHLRERRHEHQRAIHVLVNPLEVGFVPSTGRGFVFQLLDRVTEGAGAGPEPPT